MAKHLRLEMPPQPDDSTCGPTSLHAVYQYFGDRIPLTRVISEVVPLETGGTLAVLLATHALRRGYRATIYTYNLQLFDPTWFSDPDVDIAARLRAQADTKPDDRLQFATRGYLQFLTLGGTLRFRELNADLIRRYLKAGQPILTGLSATYLYGCAREHGEETLQYDDIRGHPIGHFVVLCGYDTARRAVRVADPLYDNPRYRSHIYSVDIQRVLGAILLGVLTYDANLLILEPPPSGKVQP